MEDRYLDRADPEKGRFRAFILTSLKFFLADEADRSRAQKRGGGRVLSFEISSGEDRYQREPAHNETPERILERRWALSVLDRVVDRLRAGFVQHGRLDHFNRLKAFLLDQAETPDVALAREMATSEGALKVAIHRLRKRYRDLFRQEIAETVARCGRGRIRTPISGGSADAEVVAALILMMTLAEDQMCDGEREARAMR
jgi:hypothetical protein